MSCGANCKHKELEARPTPASKRWRTCPSCGSYRFTWKPAVGWGKCQDCGTEVQK